MVDVLSSATKVVLLCGLSALLGTVDSAAAAAPVVVEIREFAGAPRSQWPVTGGVPLAQGVLRPGEAVRLYDDQGKQLALQSEPLARWEDGSVKWLLVDFLADLNPLGARACTLRIGGESSAAPTAVAPLRIEPQQGAVCVDTGLLRATLSPCFLGRLAVRRADGQWTDLVAQRGEMTVTVDGQNRGEYLSSRDEKPEIVVEQSGPVRACVRISGWHRSAEGKRFAPYVLRVHAYAGQPFLRVFHTFVNSDLPERGLMGGGGLRVTVSPADRGDVDYGGTRRQMSSEKTGALCQTAWDRQTVAHGSAPVEARSSDRGYLSLPVPGGTVAVAVRNWAQLYPKKLEYDPHGLTCWFWPPSAGPLDLRREEYKQSEEWLAFKRDYPKLYADCIDPGTRQAVGVSARRYRLAVEQGHWNIVAGASALGLSRTHEMLWVFAPEAESPNMPALTAALHEPLLPLVNPRYLDETKVLGRVGWRDAEHFPQVEKYIERKLDWAMRHQGEWSRWWGLLDWGGLRSIYETFAGVPIPGQWLKFLGRYGWQNSEVDIPHHLMFPYLRSGDRTSFHFYESVLRHQMDIETIHANLPEFEDSAHNWQAGNWTRGGQHRHCYDHYGGAPNLGHSWNEGLAGYYFLTGDRRAFDVALDVGRYSLGQPVGKVPSNFEKYTTHPSENQRFDRSPANAYRIALACYELTGEDSWKKEALRWRQHFLDHSPEYLDKQPATFHITNYVVHSLALDYHLFGDPRVAEEIVRVARWHCEHMKRGYDQRGLHYPYLACGMAWWCTRDNEFLCWPWHTYLDECRSEVPMAQSPGDFKQSQFFEIGQLPYFLSACREAGFSERNPPPKPQRAKNLTGSNSASGTQ